MHKLYRCVAFRDVPVGAEFLWGAYSAERCNWGRKRSNRTADWCPRISGELSTLKRWGYWRQNEAVYVECQP